VRRLVAGAERCAVAAGDTSVGTGHLLLALGHLDDGAAAFLRTVGSSPATLARAVFDAPRREPLDDKRFRRRRVPQSRALEEALIHAVVFAGRPRRVGVEHLLMSLSRGASSQAQDVLAALGVKQRDVQVFFARRGQRAA
jgi:ATP-dependent Clp protease ATP-binding subunit ClpA